MPDNDKNNNIYTPTTARSLRREHLVYGESHKIFLKHYRTEIAASCASLASTLLAVRPSFPVLYPWTNG